MHVFLILAFSAPVSAGVVLSEIMFDPLDDEDTDEFLELYNDSSLPVNLSSWVISDGDGSDTLIDAGFGMIALPRQFILILDPDYIEEISTTYDSLVPENALVITINGSTFGSRGLSNSDGEPISLVNAQGQEVATRIYSVGNVIGHSDEKRVINAGDEDSNWEDSETVHGTPGFRNSVTPFERNLAIVDMQASPIHPAANEVFRLFVSISNSGMQGVGGNIELRFDDMGGRIFQTIGIQAFDQIPSSDSTEIEFSIVLPYTGIARYEASLESADDDSSDNRAELLVSSQPIVGGLVINEIQYSPLGGRAEWVELINASGRSITTEGMSFSDGRGIADSMERAAMPDWVIEADGFAILADDSAILFEVIPDSVPVFIWDNAITLNNGGDSICLWSGEELLDRVDYRSSWGSGEAGFSLERVSASAGSNDAANWGDCVDASGSTPGRVNSRSILSEVPKTAGISASPDPFTPNSDGIGDVTALSFNAGQATSSVSIKIFDVRGRIIRTFHASGSASGGGSVIWDGRAEDERMMPTARYILLLEATSANGGGDVTAKSTVILARPR